MNIIDIKDLPYMQPTALGGSEASIYKLVDDRILKKFRARFNNQVRENKEKRLLLLDQIQEIKDLYPNIDSLVYDEDIFVGYLSDYYYGHPLDEVFLTFEERVILLRDIKQKLLQFKENGIYYFDLHADNILCIEENLECKFVDMDNVDILGMKRDTTPNLLRYYMQSGGKDNENALIYLFNFLTYQFIIKHNKSINLDKDAIMLCKNINCDFVDSICDHEYLIDFIDKPSKILFR